MESVDRVLNWGPQQLLWTQVGMRMGPVWHEGGVRWVGMQTVTWQGRTMQVGHVWSRRPEFAGGSK